MNLPRLAWLLPLALLQLGCPDVPDISEDAGTTGPFRVGSSGGDVVREGVVLSVPPGALAEDVVMSVTVVQTGIPEVPGRKRISWGYRVSPSNLVLKLPIKLWLPWQEDMRVPGVKLSEYDMRRNAGTTPALSLPGSAADEALPGLVKAETDKLGTFWITSPANPTISKITVTPGESAVLVGQTQQLTGKVLDAAGSEVAGVPLMWTVVPARVGTVDATGLFTATSPGSAWVTASAAGQSAEVEVHVKGTTVGPTSFVHESPFPTGNDLHGALVSAGHLAAVGNNGTVLVRDPGGSWTRLFSAPALELDAVGGVLPSAGVAVGSVGGQGAVVEFALGGAAATFKTFATCQPHAVTFDGQTGMAVGDGNDVLVYRSGQWQTEYSPSFESLLSVVGDGQGGFVTLGNLGSIYKYDPVTRAWDSLYQARLSVMLNAAQLLDASGSEAWAVGGGKAWHFSSGSWTAVNLPSSPVLDGYTSLALVDGKLVLGGYKDARGYLLWKDLTSGLWKYRTLRGPQVPRGLFGAGVVGVAVGDRGMLWEYTSDNFAETSHGQYGDIVDLAVTATSVFAAMNSCLAPACWVKDGTVLVRASDGSWNTLGGTQPFNDALVSVAARAANEVYAATASAVYRYDGSTWTALTLPPAGDTPPAFTRLALCGNSLWAVGKAGLALKGKATAGTAVDTLEYALSPLLMITADLAELTCKSDADVWIAGGGILLENGVHRDSTGFQHAGWHATWSPGTGEAFAFGDAPFGFYWDTKQLRLVDQLGGVRPSVVNGLWGSQPDNLYAVGLSSLPIQYAFALRFDGLSWTPVDPGSAQEPLVLRGRSDTELWLGTRAGGLLRAVPPPPSSP